MKTRKQAGMVDKENIVIVYGVMGSLAEIDNLVQALSPHGNVLPVVLLGHEGRPLPEKLRIETMARDILEQMDEKGMQQAIIAGHSLGGYIALWLARHYPDRLRGVCPIGTKVVYDPVSVSKFRHLVEPGRVAPLPSRHGNARREEDLRDIHEPTDWKDVLLSIRELFGHLGREEAISLEDLEAIKVPALVVNGKDDPIVTEEESREVARVMAASILVTEKPVHPVHDMPVDLIAGIFGKWIQTLG